MPRSGCLDLHGVNPNFLKKKKKKKIRSFSWSVFFRIRTEYEENLDQKSSVFRHFSRSEWSINNECRYHKPSQQKWKIMKVWNCCLIKWQNFNVHSYKPSTFDDALKRKRLVWSGNVERLSDDYWPKRMPTHEAGSTLPTGRPKHRWMNSIKRVW